MLPHNKSENIKRRALKIDKSIIRGLTGALFYASGFMFC
jgi:hypothetical protein